MEEARAVRKKAINVGSATIGAISEFVLHTFNWMKDEKNKKRNRNENEAKKCLKASKRKRNVWIFVGHGQFFTLYSLNEWLDGLIKSLFSFFFLK